MNLIKSLVFASLVIVAAAAPALASPSSCPAGQSALVQKWYTSNYCRASQCRAYVQDVTIAVCSPPTVQYPMGECVNVAYQTRPLGAPGPSSWASLPACPSGF